MLRRVCLILLLAVLPARAADKPAAPKPPVPSSEEAALRAVLKTLAKSLQDGDAEGMRSVLYAANPTERKMLDAMTSMATEIAGLHKAAAKAFGEDAANELTGDLASELSRIDDADATINGDTATVRYREHPATAPTTAPAKRDAVEADSSSSAASRPAAAPLTLKKIDGHWRVPVAELSKDTTPEEIEQRLADLDVQTKVIEELKAEIAKGKHKSVEKAADAWQAKMMQALAPKKSTSTPAHDPAKPENKPK